MSNIPAAYPSPRVANGVIRWYEGDTFSITFSFAITDQDGEPVQISQGDSVSVTFFNAEMETVKQFVFQSAPDNQIVLVFDDSVTALFPVGKYHFDIVLTHENRSTLARRDQVMVE